MLHVTLAHVMCRDPGGERIQRIVRAATGPEPVGELIARVRRAGATGPITVRADSGFYSWKLIDALTRLGVAWSVTVPLNTGIRKAIEAIDDQAWVDITYPDGGTAQVADTTYTTGTGRKKRSVRLVVRRTKLTGKANNNCGRTGDTTPSSPPSRAPRSMLTVTIGPTPSWS